MATSSPFDILFLSQRVPYPPDRGDRITTWNVLQHFLTKGKRVRVACFLENDRDEAAVEHLEGLGIQVLSERIHPRLRKLRCLPHLLCKDALTLPYFYSKRIHEGIGRWLEEGLPSLAFGYSSSMGQYFLQHESSLSDVHRIMHFAELDSDKWAQYSTQKSWPGSWVYSREARLLLDFERKLAHDMDLNLVVSTVEKDLFERRIPGAPVEVLRNGVDLQHFQPGDPTKREAATLIFTGVMNYHPNVDGVLHFARSLWPRIREHNPEARFLVVGSNPTAELRALDGKKGIEVSGRVESTVTWFERASIAVVPLRIARGIQNKVLEAMAMALPVVATPKAFSGIRALPDQDLFVAQDDETFLQHTLKLLDSPDLRTTMGQSARQAMQASYEWPTILHQLDRHL